MNGSRKARKFESLINLHFNQDNQYFTQTISKVLGDLSTILKINSSGNIDKDIEKLTNNMDYVPCVMNQRIISPEGEK